MKKYFSLLLAALLCFAGPAFASVGVYEDGTAEAIATDINFSTNLDHSTDGSTSTISVSASPTFTGNVTFQSTLLANGRAGGASTINSSSTNLAPVDLPYAYARKRVGAGVDSNPGSVLPNGKPGQTITFEIDQLQSGSSWLMTPTTKTGFTTITYDTKGDRVGLLWPDDTSGWVITNNDGATIATTGTPA